MRHARRRALQVTAKTKPPLALVKLLMVLDRHPKLLDEVRA
jgi:HTH-type transcriptional regulator/antitoxin MqsA